MHRSMLVCCRVLVASCFLSAGLRSASAQPFEAEDGFEAHELESLAPEAIAGGVAYDASGGLLAYVGADLVRWAPDGSRDVVSTFDPPVFGSFLVPAASGEGFLFGESSEGNIYSISADGSQRSLVDRIEFNYALALDPDGRGFVSTGANARQEIVLLDTDPVNTPRPIVVDMPGFSGPLAIDDGGNLYYGTADFLAPSQSLHRFSREQIEAALSGDPVAFAQGEELLGGFGGFNQMLYHGGALYFSDLGFSSGAGRVERLDILGGFESQLLLRTPHPDGVISATHIAFRPGADAFVPGAGIEGGSLAVVYSDFVTVQGITEIVPQLFFQRGEINGDGVFDLSDVVWFLNYFFLGGSEPSELEAADMNGDGTLDVTDAVFGLSYLFLNGPPPPAPFPEVGPAE